MIIDENTFGFCLLTPIIISYFRNLLFDFLIGSKGRRNAEKIKKASKWRERFLARYIRPYIVQHVKAFKWFYSLYIAYICSLIPQTVLLIYSKELEQNGNPYGVRIATCIIIIDCILALYLGCVYVARDGSKYRYPEKKMKKR